jgi:hypothetical protein
VERINLIRSGNGPTGYTEHGQRRDQLLASWEDIYEADIPVRW